MRGLTLWQPMAWAVAEGWKPVENRQWPLPKNMIGQRFAVHAGMRYDEAWAALIRDRFGIAVPTKAEIALGAVVAVATFRGDVDENSLDELGPKELFEMGMPAKLTAIHDWFSGPHGFLLSDVQQLVEPVPARGSQGLWSLPPAVENLVLERLPRTAALSEAAIDAMAYDALQGVASDAAKLAISAERNRCLEIVRARSTQWSGSNLVVSVLDRLAEEIEKG